MPIFKHFAIWRWLNSKKALNRQCNATPGCIGDLNFLQRAYSYAKGPVSDKVLGKTTSSLKEKYTADYFSNSQPADRGYFERGLEVVSAFRAAKKYGKPAYSKIALSKFEALKKELATKKDEAALLLTTDIWMNVEAYQATGDENYAKAAKKDADVLVDGMMGDLGFVTRGKESQAEDQLLAASALLQLYELYPKAEKYKTKAEGILEFFEKRHAKRDGGIRETLEIEFEKGLKFRDVSKNGNNSRSVYLKNLAALTYMNAHRITDKYGPEAKRFFSHSDKSLLLYSEASRAFKMKEYSKDYGELLKRELDNPAGSASNLAGVIGVPSFNVEPADPGLFRELLGVNFAAAFGIGFVGTILPFYMASAAGIGATWYGFSLGATCLANVVTQPYIGRIADRVGKKTVLAAGLAAYAASILLTPGSIANYKEMGLMLTSMARGVSGSAAGPPISSLVADAAPASQRTEAFARMNTAYSAGYAVSSFASGPVYEHMKLASEFGNFVPFVAAAFLPAALAVKLYSGYRKKALRMKTLDSIFSETRTENMECEPPAAVEQAIRGASAV